MKTRIIYPKNIWYDKQFRTMSVLSKLVCIYLVSNENIGLTRMYEQRDLEIQFIFDIDEETLLGVKTELQNNSFFFFKDEWVYINNDFSYCDYEGRDRVMQSKTKELDSIPADIKAYFEEVIKGLERGYKPPINNKSKTINHKPKTINHKSGGVGEVEKSREYMKSSEHLEALRLMSSFKNYVITDDYFATTCQKVEDWVESKGKKVKSWPAQLRTFIMRDIENNKLLQK